jgi:hypothetical protein
MPLGYDELNQIVGKVFKTRDETSLSQEMALVQVKDENYYSLTELCLVFVDN